MPRKSKTNDVANTDEKNTAKELYSSLNVDITDYGVYILNGPIDDKSAEELIEYIIRMNILCPKGVDSIKLIINSVGGEIYNCFAIIDAIKSSTIPIVTYGTGMVASSALMIFISGTKGSRFLSPACMVLSHQFSLYMGDFGTKEHELKAEQKMIDIIGKQMLELYKQCTGLSEASIKKNLLPPNDVYLTPNEAKKYKLCDHVANVCFTSKDNKQEPGEVTV